MVAGTHTLDTVLPTTKRLLRVLCSWVDNDAGATADNESASHRIDWARLAPFIAIHLGCLGVFWVGWSPLAVLTAVGLYVVRMLAVTGFNHRYFSHRSFKTSRGVQFVFALIGASAVQRGPLWWAAHHRHHHSNSDQAGDSHSPHQDGFLWSHMGWFMSRKNFPTKIHLVPDLMKYPELRFLDRFDALVPVLLAMLLYAAGVTIGRYAPTLGVTGGQLLIWGFCISTVTLYHATFTINSLAHRLGTRRYATRDESRNNLGLAILTFGEGWHNNHHHYPGSVRQGFFWWEVDLTYYFLRLLGGLGLIWELRTVPMEIRAARLITERAAP